MDVGVKTDVLLSMTAALHKHGGFGSAQSSKFTKNIREQALLAEPSCCTAQQRVKWSKAAQESLTVLLQQIQSAEVGIGPSKVTSTHHANYLHNQDVRLADHNELPGMQLGICITEVMQRQHVCGALQRLCGKGFGCDTQAELFTSNSATCVDRGHSCVLQVTQHVWLILAWLVYAWQRCLQNPWALHDPMTALRDLCMALTANTVDSQ